MQSTSLPTDRRELAALLGGLSLFLSTIEYLVPKPVPYIRLGLANLPILLGLDVLPVGYLFLVMAVKVVGQGLLNGTFASYVVLFSLAGSVTSTCVMIIAHKLGKRAISLLGISVFGALASNSTQILLSIVFIFGANARVIAPIFLGFGTASGVVMGLFALLFARRSRWYKAIHEKFATRPS